MSKHDRLSGVFYLQSLWNALKAAFNLPLPNVCITMGFPSRMARTRASNRAPGEILDVSEWKGDEKFEKTLVSIHPERFEDVQQVARATLFVIGNEVYGSRRNLGSLTLGIEMDKNTGLLGFTKDEKGQHAERTLSTLIKQLGAIPEGFADLPEPKVRQVARQRKYACEVCNQIIRVAADDLQAICLGVTAKRHPQNPGQFRLQTIKPAQSSEAAPTPAAKPPVRVAETSQENILNVIKAVRAGAAKMVHGRNFGVETEVEATA